MKDNEIKKVTKVSYFTKLERADSNMVYIKQYIVLSYIVLNEEIKTIHEFEGDSIDFYNKYIFLKKELEQNRNLYYHIVDNYVIFE